MWLQRNSVKTGFVGANAAVATLALNRTQRKCVKCPLKGSKPFETTGKFLKRTRAMPLAWQSFNTLPGRKQARATFVGVRANPLPDEGVETPAGAGCFVLARTPPRCPHSYEGQ